MLVHLFLLNTGKFLSKSLTYAYVHLLEMEFL